MHGVRVDQVADDAGSEADYRQLSLQGKLLHVHDIKNLEVFTLCDDLVCDVLMDSALHQAAQAVKCELLEAIFAYR